MKLDIVSSWFIPLTHMAPIWEALPEENRGTVYLRKGLKTSLRPVKYYKEDSELLRLLKGRENPILTALYKEALKLKGLSSPVILMEHGAGQTYISPNPDYASGVGDKKHIDLFLSPNEHNAEAYRKKWPGAKVEIIGCPKLDKWYNYTKERSTPPNIVFSTHADIKVVPETRSGFSHFEPALANLAKSTRYKVFGHGHPGIIKRVAPIYQKYGIPMIRSFEEVMKIADLYLCDNSSTLFEFASTNRPVVVLNPPWYRKDVNHGLRFWEYAEVGYQCERPEDLIRTISLALRDPKAQKERRSKIVELVYPIRGNAAKTAADVIISNFSVDYYVKLVKAFNYEVGGRAFRKDRVTKVTKRVYDQFKDNPYFKVWKEDGYV